jgi:hypothetical protein
MCSRSVNIRFPKEGSDDQSTEDSDWCTQVIPEIFETAVDFEKEKIVIAPVEFGDE